MTQIIATIGPVSCERETLEHFAKHKVAYARLNFSHGTSSWHLETARKARQAGLKTIFDLAGPKVLVGTLQQEAGIESGSRIIFEKYSETQKYPFSTKYSGENMQVIPSHFDLSLFVQPGEVILIDDGKLECLVEKVDGDKVICRVIFGGIIKSNKGLNLPDTKLNIDFLVDRDVQLLQETLPEFQPDYIAPSFVKTVADLKLLQNFVESIYQKSGLTGKPLPKICTKIEMAEAMMPHNLSDIIEFSDMIMIARGDLALETKPLHIKVPALQAKLASECKKTNTPFIVATQMLESMFNSPVPTRAETSDLYRAVHIDKANFIMLSAETAAGKFPKKCVEFMEKMIDLELE